MALINELKKMSMTRLKLAAGALAFLKIFGFVKSLMFLLGGVGGFLLAQHMLEEDD